MNSNSIYYKQVQLLVRVMPLIATEKCFALKGGTAINLFVRDMPRLSVDIDLVYLPMEERDEALKNIRAALSRISALIEKNILGAKVQNAHEQSDALRLIVVLNGVRIKIELSPVIRGTVFPESVRGLSKRAEATFGYAEMQVVSLPDLYAGKIAAALDRQHPRDLFDIKFLLDNEGFTDDFRKTFLVFLISHHRPMTELLEPNRKDIKTIYEQEFRNMADQDISLETLLEVREKIITLIHDTMTPDEKQFLFTFKARTPQWELLGLQNPDVIAQLPSVRWKMKNLEQMDQIKHQKALEKLVQILKV